MKTYLVLFAVLFCLVFISFFGSSEENAVPVFNENSDELFYDSYFNLSSKSYKKYQSNVIYDNNFFLKM